MVRLASKLVMFAAVVSALAAPSLADPKSSGTDPAWSHAAGRASVGALGPEGRQPASRTGVLRRLHTTMDLNDARKAGWGSGSKHGHKSPARILADDRPA